MNEGRMTGEQKRRKKGRTFRVEKKGNASFSLIVREYQE